MRSRVFSLLVGAACVGACLFSAPSAAHAQTELSTLVGDTILYWGAQGSRKFDVKAIRNVVDKDLATPPGSPTTGQWYIVAASPTGAWSGHAGDLARYGTSTWTFWTPADGWLVWVVDEELLYVHDGEGWASAVGGGGGSGDVVGPSGATDNAIARYDSTTGKLLQNSAVTIADTTGSITLPSGGTVDGRDVSVDGTALDAHIANTSNPHSVTAAQLGAAVTSGTLGQFASTTSAALRTVLSDETGTGAAVFADGALGTPASGVATNLTGTAAGLTAGNVTTNANLTGPITSVGNATTVADNELAALAAVVSAADKGFMFTGVGTGTTFDLTTAGLALLDDASASAQRTTLGLGTLATQSGTFSGTSSGTNTGDQTITLTGDVTGSGTGSFAATIGTDAVTYGKMQNVSATDRLLGRDTAAAGDVEELTVGGGVEFTGSGGIQRSALTGAVTASAGSNATSYGDNEIAALSTTTAAADKLPYFDGASTATTATFTSAGRALIDDADASAQRTTLGLGSLATLSAAPGTFVGTTLLTSASGTFTTGSGTNTLRIIQCGAGGGGGGTTSSASNAAAGGGGGAGGCYYWVVTVSPSTGYSYTTGTGGTAGSSSGGTGGTGGNSTFVVGGTTATANGGLGGIGMTAGTTPLMALGGAGGAISTNGTQNGAGAQGSMALRLAGTGNTVSGGGGASLLGAGADGSSSTGAGATGKSCGGGASGGVVINGSSAVAGGVGAAGCAIVEEYR